MARNKGAKPTGRTTIGIVAQKHGNSGKAVVKKAPLKTTKRAAIKPPVVNLSNTYGITGSSKYNVAAPGGLPGAVKQGTPPNKHYKRAKDLMQGGT